MSAHVFQQVKIEIEFDFIYYLIHFSLATLNVVAVQISRIKSLIRIRRGEFFIRKVKSSKGGEGGGGVTVLFICDILVIVLVR